MIAAMTAFTIGAILVATTPPDQIYWLQIFFAVIITPFGMDMSFPAGTICLSNSVPREKQGIAASLVSTVVNYSISIGLGIAGTVEEYAKYYNGTSDVLFGYRAALYTAIALGSTGIIVSVIFHIKTQLFQGKKSETESKTTNVVALIGKEEKEDKSSKQEKKSEEDTDEKDTDGEDTDGEDTDEKDTDEKDTDEKDTNEDTDEGEKDKKKHKGKKDKKKKGKDKKDSSNSDNDNPEDTV